MLSNHPHDPTPCLFQHLPNWAICKPTKDTHSTPTHLTANLGNGDQIICTNTCLHLLPCSNIPHKLPFIPHQHIQGLFGTSHWVLARKYRTHVPLRPT